MNPDLLWFVQLGIEQGLFTRLECTRARRSLGGKPGMLDFAQKLIDESVVTNVEALEKLAGMAAVKAKGGPPALDPFAAPEERIEEKVMTAAKTGAGPMPAYPAGGVASLDD